VTYFETTGRCGVMETAAGSPDPERFRSIPGAVFPVYHVLADAGEVKGAVVERMPTTQPLQCDGVALRTADGLRVLAANLTDDMLRFNVTGVEATGRIRILDEQNAQDAMTDPEGFRSSAWKGLGKVRGVLELALRPYAVATIDLSESARL
jgi:hypothetical protein